MRKILVWLSVILCPIVLKAQEEAADSIRVQLFKDSLENTFTYQHGKITFPNDLGTLNVPDGFKYLDSIQAERVIKDLWGNPHGAGTLGMIMPENLGVMDAWAFIITYDNLGHVKDDDAEDIDYDEMLVELQKETNENNVEREKQGFDKITFVGWAAKPYYDKDKNTLHWAKELKFGDNEDDHTLNYNVRILCRKGVMVLNAVATMSELEVVQQNIEKVQSSVAFNDGNKYSDFDPDIDDVAAWTIGGLVAGKVLAKVGFFALFLKYIKVIGLALAAAGGAIWKWIKGKRESERITITNTDSDSSNQA
jgi:uncharacterized membrane-anchored protein